MWRFDEYKFVSEYYKMVCNLGYYYVFLVIGVIGVRRYLELMIK